MSVDVATLRAVLVADTAKYNRNIDNAGRKADRFGRDSERSFNRAGAAAKRSGDRMTLMSRAGSRGLGVLATGAKAGGIAFGVALAAGVKKSTDEFRESQKVGRQTDAVLKSTHKTAGMSKKAIESLAQSLSKKTAIDDEAVQSTENLLLTFTNIGKKGGIFKKTTALALDMSAALKQDTKSSAIQLGKALNNPIKGVTALTRVGVSFTAQQKEQIKALVASGDTLKAQKLVMAEVTKEFGGSAEAIATPMDRLNVTLGNIAETAGSFIVPAFDAAATSVNNFLNGMQSGTGAGGNFAASIVSGFNTVKSYFSGGGGKDFISALQTIKAEAGPIIQGLGQMFDRFILPVVRRALPGVIQVFQGMARMIKGAVQIISGILHGDFGKAWQGVKNIFTGALKAVGGIFRAATAPIRSAAAAVWEGVKSGAVKAWDGIHNTIAGFVNRIIDLINKIPGVDIGKVSTVHHYGKHTATTKEDSKGNKNTVVKAVGGWIGAPGERGRDDVPVMLGRGEAVLNHQQQRIANQFIPGGLNAVFSATRGSKHYMAGGGFAGLKAGPMGMTGGAGQVVSGVTGWALAQAKKYANKLNPFGGKGGGIGKGVAGSLKGAMALARSLGLAITSTTGGAHARTSWHYKGRAFDAAGAPGNMASYYRAAKARYGSHLLELFYDPLGGIKNGRNIGAVGGHSDHVHTALAGGGYVGKAGRIKNLWLKAGGSKKMATLMTAIALAESGGNAGSVNRNTNGTIDEGLWQINSVHGFKGMKNPLKNAKAAMKILKSQGLKAWVAYNNGSYKKYMGAAGKAKGTGSDTSKSVARSIDNIGTRLQTGGLTPGQAIKKYKALLKRQMSNSQHNTILRKIAAARKKSTRGGASTGEDPVENAIQSILQSTEDRKTLGYIDNTEARRIIQGMLDQGGIYGKSYSTHQRAELTSALGQYTDETGSGPDLAQAMADLAAEVKRLNDNAEKTHGINAAEFNRAFLDWISGQLGGRAAAGYRTNTPAASY